MKKIILLLIILLVITGCGENKDIPKDKVQIPDVLAEIRSDYKIESARCFYNNTEYYEDIYCGGDMFFDVKSNVGEKERVYFDVVIDAYNVDGKHIGTVIQKSRLSGNTTKEIKVDFLPFNNVDEYKVKLDNISKIGDEDALHMSYTYDYEYVDYLLEKNNIKNGIKELSNSKKSADKLINIINQYFKETQHFSYVSKTTERGVTFYQYETPKTSQGNATISIRFKNGKFFGVTLIDSEVGNYSYNTYQYKEILTVLFKIYNEKINDFDFYMGIGISSKDYEYENEEFVFENSSIINIFTVDIR